MLSCEVIVLLLFFVFGRFIFREKRVPSCSTRTPFPSSSICAKIEAAFERNSSNVTGSSCCAIVLSCFLKCSKTYLQHLRTCFNAESFTLSAERASASRSTGEFVSRRSHNRDIRYQTESFSFDHDGGVQITVMNGTALFAHPYPVGKC